MENNFYRKVNIVEDWAPRFSNSIEWDKITPGTKSPPYERHFSNIDEIVPSNIIQRLHDVGLTIRTIRIFSWPILTECKWHLDGRSWIQQTAMNFVLFGAGTMQWAGENVKVRSKPPFVDSFWDGVRSSPDRQIIEQTSIPAGIYNISIPHRIVTGPEGRISMGIMWKEKCDYPFLQIVERLTDAGFIDKE